MAAPLLDVVRRERAPGALVLCNVTKDGAAGRGSGVLEDRMDNVFEARDVTGFVPTERRPWWEEMPPAARRGHARDARAQRSRRMNARTTRGRRPTVRDVQARLEQLAHENLMLADSLAVLNTSTRHTLNVLTGYLLSLRHALLEHGLLSAEDLATVVQIADLGAMFEKPDPADTTETA